MSSNNREVTVSAAGLTAFVADLLSFETKTRMVEKVAEQTGRYYSVTETIPTEEIFTLVGIRNGEDGKFVIQVQNDMLDKLNRMKVRDEKVTEYENL